MKNENLEIFLNKKINDNVSIEYNKDVTIITNTKGVFQNLALKNDTLKVIYSTVSMLNKKGNPKSEKKKSQKKKPAVAKSRTKQGKKKKPAKRRV
jgi:hypothetical protein